MKKIIFAILSLALVFTLTAKLSYAESSPTKNTAPEVSEAKIGGGETKAVETVVTSVVNAKEVAQSATATPEEKKIAQELVNADNELSSLTKSDDLAKKISKIDNKYDYDDYELTELFDVSVSDELLAYLKASDENYIELTFDYTVANKNAKPVVAHKVDGTWVVLKDEDVKVGTNTITGKFSSLCPIAIYELALDATPASPIWWILAIVAIVIIIVIIVLLLSRNKKDENPFEEENEEPVQEETPAEEPAEEPVQEETPAEEPAEEPVEETPVEEEPAEEPVEETPVEEPVEEEPVQEEVKPEPKPEPVEVPLEDIPEDERPIEGDKYLVISYNESHVAKIAMANKEIKGYYSLVKNALMSYKLKNRVSTKYETFNAGRDKIAKLVVKGKTLTIYLALDPAQYTDSKYKLKDSPKSKAYATMPAKYQINGERKAKYACELIDEVAQKLNIDKKKKFNEVDYTKEYVTETERTLIEKGLIKVATKETTEVNDKMHYVKMMERTSVYNIHKAMNNRDALSLVEKESRSVDDTNQVVVFIDTICENFNEGETVTLDEIKKRIPDFDKSATSYKVKPRGKITKKLTVNADAFTLGAVKMILLLGGRVITPTDVEEDE